ncbi:STAS domain-containing protein [Zooshikella harenae]|uniref:Anti-sigma factor antagonist n=1 Tax=Zooshikella harenae TaxID=2827238 RepID=A0ABS5ZC11_9GAMM|nr:STAS domain-containing protein [Zooshikella harenae]MBU2711520.1 STAS domain-containing protein [Zooshikella harenae]
MEFKLYKCHDSIVIALNRDFDAKTAAKIRPIFDKLIDRAEGDMLVDLSAVLFLDSTGIGTLVHFYKKSKEKGKKLILIGADGQPMGLMAMLRLNRIIKHFPSMEDYLVSTGKSHQADLEELLK